MKKMKTMYVIHRDAEHNMVRTKIAEGTTGDFATPIGVYVYDTLESSKDEDTSQFEYVTGVNGVYSILKDESIKRLEGKLLTLVDLAFTNKEQREAFKSMVRQALWDLSKDEAQALMNRINEIK